MYARRGDIIKVESNVIYVCFTETSNTESTPQNLAMVEE